MSFIVVTLTFWLNFMLEFAIRLRPFIQLAFLSAPACSVMHTVQTVTNITSNLKYTPERSQSAMTSYSAPVRRTFTVCVANPYAFDNNGIEGLATTYVWFMLIKQNPLQNMLNACQYIHYWVHTIFNASETTGFWFLSTVIPTKILPVNTFVLYDTSKNVKCYRSKSPASQLSNKSFHQVCFYV